MQGLVRHMHVSKKEKSSTKTKLTSIERGWTKYRDWLEAFISTIGMSFFQKFDNQRSTHVPYLFVICRPTKSFSPNNSKKTCSFNRGGHDYPWAEYYYFRKNYFQTVIRMSKPLFEGRLPANEKEYILYDELFYFILLEPWGNYICKNHSATEVT